MTNSRRKILIVDDNVANLSVGRNLLKAYYEVYLASSAAQMFEMLEKIRPDLILLDIDMPEMDGYEAITKLKANERFANIPIMFLTAQNNVDGEIKGFDLGAMDYINKPFIPSLLLKRIEHQLLLVQQNEIIMQYTNNLSVLVSEKVSEVIGLQNAILDTVADLVEFRDKFTGDHITRTGQYLKLMMDGLLESRLYVEELSGWDIDGVVRAAHLHDVGKIAISDSILNKPGRFTPDEFEIMKTHVMAGIDAVNRIISKTSGHAFLRHVLNIVGAHHEKWDGTGYPYGLKGLNIPLEGRLMAVVDVYDALISWRPYKEKIAHEKAVTIIREGRGTHFDPILVDVFLSQEGKFKQIASIGSNGKNVTSDLFTLTRDIGIGIPEIDAQHRSLIDRLNNMLINGEGAASKGETRKTLDFLGWYVVKHFGDEEALQEQSGYPKYEWHKGQHELYIEEYKTLLEKFNNTEFSGEFVTELRDKIVNWITNHIKTVDMEFGQYYQIRNASFIQNPIGGI